MGEPAPGRRRNAATTRAAILVSARVCFARAGYDGAGVREIAEGAGVTAMMVNRYFGSKEQLFAEVVAETMAAPTILIPEILTSADLGTAIATALMGITRADAVPLEGFQIMLRSASSDRAAEIARDQIEKHYARTMTDALTGEFAAQRAALVFAVVAGVQAMRQMIGLSALADADPETLVALLAKVFRVLVDEPDSGTDP